MGDSTVQETAEPEDLVHLPPIPQEGVEEGRILFKDGSTAFLRPAHEDDIPRIVELLESVSDRTRRLRFFTGTAATEKKAERVLQIGDPEEQYTLVVLRGDPDDPEIIGVGSYIRESDEEPDVAETSYLVRDDYQGKGIGTLLLERLALIAVRNGFEEFRAYTLPENQRMLDVFRSSGFPVEESSEEGMVSVSFSVQPSKEMVERAEMRDRISTVASLQPFFKPKSVALIGASREPGSIGHRVLHSLISGRFNGPVYPINPNADFVSSISAYDSVLDVPGELDLAIIAVPPPVVPEVVEECHRKGVKALVVLTAGYSEVGPEGEQRQKELREQVIGHGMRMVGPNCLGILNTDPGVSLNASFSPVFPSPGNVAMASQSGALGLAILDYADNHGVGFSSFVSLGNKADVSGNDLIQYWEEDGNTDVILLYLESFGNPRRFARLTQRVGLKKPILVVKGGRSEAGKKAASSHTAALTSPNVAVEALFEQAGIVSADSLEEMFDVAAFLSSQPLPQGPNVAIVTNAGGPGILCADACENGGLQLSELTESTREQLRSFLPEMASVTNPVDMIAAAGPEEYRRTISTVMEDPGVDAVVVIYIPLEISPAEDVARSIEDGVRHARENGGERTPVVSVFMEAVQGKTTLQLDDERIPAYRFPESAATALSKGYRYIQWRNKARSELSKIPRLPGTDTETAREMCEPVAEQGGGWLGPLETVDVLEAVGITVAEMDVATTPDQAVEIADRLGYPVVCKMASRTLVHKTEWEGIELNIRNEEEVRGAYEEIRSRLEEAGRIDELDGIAVQEQIDRGIELMVGMSEDPLFGPLISFGLGGIYVEILNDVSVRITPLTERDATEMMDDIRGRRLLDGYRGRPAADRDALKKLLLRLSRLVEEVPEIEELDINPLKAFPPGEGYSVVDARIRIRESEEVTPTV